MKLGNLPRSWRTMATPRLHSAAVDVHLERVARLGSGDHRAPSRVSVGVRHVGGLAHLLVVVAVGGHDHDSARPGEMDVIVRIERKPLRSTRNQHGAKRSAPRTESRALREIIRISPCRRARRLDSQTWYGTRLRRPESPPATLG